MVNWTKYNLGDIASIYDGPHATPKKVDSGPIFLGISNLNKGRLDLKEVEFLSESDFAKWTKRVTPEKDDIVFSYETRLGEAAIIPENLRCCLGRRMGLLRVNSLLVNPKFLLYYYISPIFREVIESRKNHGSPVDRIPLTELPNYPIYLPTLSVQKQIASILSSLDDKIELARRMNQTLEQIVATLFKKYFVDDIDPDNLPEGWKKQKVSEQFNISIGRTPPRAQAEWFSTDPKDMKWVSIKDMGNSDVYIIQTSEYLTIDAVKKFNVPIIPKDTVILSFKLTVGRVSITTCDMLSNEAIAHFNLKDHSYLSPFYTYMVLKNFDYDSLGNTSSIATAVNSQTVKDMKLIVPPKALVEKYTETVRPIFEHIRKNIEEAETLRSIRDTLLPKLMSGEIDLSAIHQNEPQYEEVLS